MLAPRAGIRKFEQSVTADASLDIQVPLLDVGKRLVWNPALNTLSEVCGAHVGAPSNRLEHWAAGRGLLTVPPSGMSVVALLTGEYHGPATPTP